MVLKKGLLTLGLAVALTGCVLEANSPISSRASEAQDLVPESAAVVAFADARAVMENKNSIVALDNSGDAAAAWDQVRAALGAINMDVERDLDFVVGYAERAGSPVVTAVGSFDLEAIGDYLAEKLPEAKRTDLNGLTVWTVSEGPNHGAFGITENGSRMVVAQDTEAIQRALTVRGGLNLAEIAGPAMDNDTSMAKTTVAWSTGTSTAITGRANATTIAAMPRRAMPAATWRFHAERALARRAASSAENRMATELLRARPIEYQAARATGMRRAASRTGASNVTRLSPLQPSCGDVREPR